MSNAQQPSATVELSVVIPVYRASDCLRPLHQRISSALEPLMLNYEIIMVEDCGPDDSWQILKELALQDPIVKAHRLSRNFGQHAAITAGLSRAKGQWAVVMDCDLQDPPEYICDLFQKAKTGYDIVFAKRKEKRHSTFRKWSARLYFKVLNAITGSQIDGQYGTFSIISRPVIDAFLQVQDRNRHFLFILYWLGFKATSIEYEHGERYSGESSYTIAALCRHAIEGVFFQTTRILRWIIYFGFMIALAGLVYAVLIIYQYITSALVPGWPSIAVLILVLGGLTLVSIGIVGLYIGQIFEQVQGRPLYIIQEVLNDEVPA